MSKKINIIILVCLTIALYQCDSRLGKNKSLNDVFAEKLPDKSPVLFLPELLDEKMNIQSITFSKDYMEFYFTQFKDDTIIMTSQMVSGKWKKPSPAKFSGTYCDFEPFISPDGQSLYFASKRPSKGKSNMQNDIDIWKVYREGPLWSEPEILNDFVNTDCMEYYPSVTKKGNLYFGRNDSALTRGDIYFSEIVHGKYSDPRKLPETINLPATSFNAYISPDEKYIIFSTYIFEIEHWHSDLFISHRIQNGNWGDAFNLGNTINSKGNELSPWVSYDGKYLFFASTRSDTSGINKKYNIYWISTSAIKGFN
jgi:Tol biopolymer transport system component